MERAVRISKTIGHNSIPIPCTFQAVSGIRPRTSPRVEFSRTIPGSAGYDLCNSTPPAEHLATNAKCFQNSVIRIPARNLYLECEGEASTSVAARELRAHVVLANPQDFPLA